MIRFYEYHKDRRGNYVTQNPNAPFRWFMVTRPRSFRLNSVRIVACLETFIKRKRHYITGLVYLSKGCFYLGDVKGEVIVVLKKERSVIVAHYTKTKHYNLADRKRVAKKIIVELERKYRKV